MRVFVVAQLPSIHLKFYDVGLKARCVYFSPSSAARMGGSLKFAPACFFFLSSSSWFCTFFVRSFVPWCRLKHCLSLCRHCFFHSPLLTFWYQTYLSIFSTMLFFSSCCLFFFIIMMIRIYYVYKMVVFCFAPIDPSFSTNRQMNQYGEQLIYDHLTCYHNHKLDAMLCVYYIPYSVVAFVLNCVKYDIIVAVC